MPSHRPQPPRGDSGHRGLALREGCWGDTAWCCWCLGKAAQRVPELPRREEADPGCPGAPVPVSGAAEGGWSRGCLHSSAQEEAQEWLLQAQGPGTWLPILIGVSGQVQARVGNLSFICVSGQGHLQLCQLFQLCHGHRGSHRAHVSPKPPPLWAQAWGAKPGMGILLWLQSDTRTPSAPSLALCQPHIRSPGLCRRPRPALPPHRATAA